MPKRTGDYREWQLQQLTDPEAATSYLNAALEDSLEMFRIAIANVAKAHQVSKVAQRAGVAREAIYRTFSAVGNPTLETLVTVLRELRLQLAGVKPLATEKSAAARPKLRASGPSRRRAISQSALCYAGQLEFDFENAAPNETGMGVVLPHSGVFHEASYRWTNYLQRAGNPEQGLAGLFIPPTSAAAVDNLPIG